MIQQRRRLSKRAKVRIVFEWSFIEGFFRVGQVDMVVAGAGTGEIERGGK